MRIIKENDKESYFILNGRKIFVNNYNDIIEIYEEEDPVHTGHSFNDLHDFFYFINALTEIAKELKNNQEELYEN